MVCMTVNGTSEKFDHMRIFETALGIHLTSYINNVNKGKIAC